MKAARLTSNTIIDALIGRNRFITKTLTKRGAVYAFDDTMQIIPRDVAERMVSKGILVSDDALPGPPPRGQTYRLASPEAVKRIASASDGEA